MDNDGCICPYLIGSMVVTVGAFMAALFGAPWQLYLGIPLAILVLAGMVMAAIKLPPYLRQRKDRKLREEAERVMKSVAPPRENSYR